MRPIGVVMIGFFYLLSGGYFIADVILFTPLGLEVDGLTGVELDTAQIVRDGNFTAQFDRATEITNTEANIFDQVLGASFQGFEAVWSIFTLLTGQYFWNVLAMLGVHGAVIAVLQGIFALIVVRTVIYFILGR